MRTGLIVLLVIAVGRETVGDARPAMPHGHLHADTIETWDAAPDAARHRARPPARAAAGGQAGASGSIRGRVEVRDPVAPPAARPGVSALAGPSPRDTPDYRSAVVFLEAAPAGAFETHEPMRERIDQRNETFVPRVVAVTAGSLVDFPNNDETYHNVFSLSKTRRFDLGRYPRGRSRSVRFDRPGVVRVFCDIHSHMSAYVLVFSHRFFAATAPDGAYRIDRVPPGQYTVAAWYEGEVRATRTVTIPPQGGPVDLDFPIR